MVLAPFALLGLVREGVRLARRRPGVWRAEAGWVVGLPLAYFVLLPYGHIFSRYLIPALPAFSLLGTGMLKDLAARLPRRPAVYAGAAAAAILLAFQIRGAARAAPTYAESCRYLHQRHERTGEWLAANTPPGAVVAAHDIGAIAFLSKRRVVDLVGIVTPGAVRHLNQPDYLPYLESLLAAQRVSHLAVLRNWLAVDNVKPLFTADPRPEVMEVYPWIPGRTHLVPEEAERLEEQATRALRAGQNESALAFIQNALRADPESARLWGLAGNAWELADRPERAEECYRRAVALFPDADEPRFRLSLVQAKQNKVAEARETLAPLVGRQPAIPGVEELKRLLGP
jgi:tetratricopeptide (TPR) repeat protein